MKKKQIKITCTGTDYKDIDVMVAVKEKFWEKTGEKYHKILEIKKQAKRKGLNLDIKIFQDKEIIESYPHNITLIYELGQLFVAGPA